MPDIEITRDSELMVAQAYALTEQAVDFIDGWMGHEYVVVDSGRIIIPEGELEEFVKIASGYGVTAGEE